jgi:hypothetical protein
MTDDGKRSELICTKVTERMALDLLHAAADDDRSVSDYLFRVVRMHLYGREGRHQSVKVDKVDHDSR